MAVQGCTKGTFPGCVKLGESVGFCFPPAGRRMQFFHPIFTQPGKVLLLQPRTNIDSDGWGGVLKSYVQRSAKVNAAGCVTAAGWVNAAGKLRHKW